MYQALNGLERGDDRLKRGGCGEDAEADRDRAHAGARADYRPIDEPVRMAVVARFVFVIVIVMATS
jgi:hypothetical protein